MWCDDENFEVNINNLKNLFSNISLDKFYRVGKTIPNVFHGTSGKITIIKGSVLRISEDQVFYIFTVDGSKSTTEFKTLLHPKIIDRKNMGYKFELIK